MAYFVSEVGVFNYGILPNVWLGVTVENRRAAYERLPVLMGIPAAKRFVSCEPLLEYVCLELWRSRVDWVIAGCESGGKRRHAEEYWFISLYLESETYGIPFFLKQMEIDGKVVKMPELDGKTWSEMPK